MAAGDGGIFRGLGFILGGFEDDPATEEKYRQSIKSEGGIMEKLYKWKGQYVVVSSATQRYSDPLCVKARENGAILVNELWLEDSIERGVLYRPPMSLGGMKGAPNLKVAHLGFPRQESRRIERLVEMIGAQNASRSDCSHLICNQLEDYEKAKSNDVFTVNKKWLEDTVTEWEEVSVDNYISWPKKENTPRPKKDRNYRTPGKDKSVVNYERGSSSTGHKVKAHSGSPENRRSVKRHAVSAGPKALYVPAERPAAFCRRSINFNWKKLSDYEARGMLVTVQIPRSMTQITLGNDDLKADLLGSYTALSNIHGGGECVRTAITADRFSVCINSGQVILDHPQLVEYQESLALANRSQFVQMVESLLREKGCRVPADIALWLRCIGDSDKVSDKVLKKHVNMLHAIDLYGSFISMYSIVLDSRTRDRTTYGNIVKSKHLRKYHPWVKKIFSWKLLNDTVNYIDTNKILRSQAKSGGVSGDAVTCTPKVRDNNAFGILEVFRDCFTHPASMYHDLLLAVLLSDSFPALLSDLQRSLHELGLLKNLK